MKSINDLYVSKFLEFINAKSENDITALIWAADKCNTGIVTLLLSTAKEVFKDNPEMFFEFINAKSKKGVTALIAADKGNTETATLLLNTAKEVFKDNPEMFFEFINAKDENGVTALTAAVTFGHKDILELLLNTAKELFKDNPKMFLEFIQKYLNHELNISKKNSVYLIKLILDISTEVFKNDSVLLSDFHGIIAEFLCK